MAMTRLRYQLQAAVPGGGTATTAAVLTATLGAAAHAGLSPSTRCMAWTWGSPPGSALSAFLPHRGPR